MNKRRQNSGFALALTLVLMALLVVIVVAYLTSTRIERSTAAVHANRLRAKITADSGLASAIHLLKENTRYGNYITAMPAPSPSPAPLYTEVYRPADPADPSHAAKSNDILTLSNAAGEILVSRATNTTSPGAEPRPTPDKVPTPAATFALPSPIPALVEEIFPAGATASPSGNSYNFNQKVRVGPTDGRLVQPSPTVSPPAVLGQWVNVRNSAGELVGRYAFFIEDESMKVNLDATGNASPTPRPNDLTSASFPASQVLEIDPSGVLPTAANRTNARSALVALGVAGSRLSSKASAAFADAPNWQTYVSNYLHMTTVLSRSDLTTARGWKRLDLNALVASATTNAQKVAVAQRIADWIRDAWTGPTSFASLQPYQMFSDDRLRYQLAANIVDYIDADNVPTDMGNFPDIGQPANPAAGGYPVLGIEKIPYLVELDVSYKSTVTNPGTVGMDDSGQASIAVNFRVNFQNLFETDLNLEDSVGKIRIKGIPSIDKEGKRLFDHSTDFYEIPVGATAASSDATATAPISGSVPWGGDNIVINATGGAAGVKSFTTNGFLTIPVTYKPSDPSSTNDSVISLFESGLMEIEVIGKNGERLDSTKISFSSRLAKLDNSASNPKLNHDFLEKSSTASSINAHYGRFTSGATLSFGDPRYRPTPIISRWYTVSRTDSQRLGVTQDIADMDPRAYSIDWYDYVGDRPLLFHRNGPMISIGELGNVSACEYPWRTLYLQYLGRSQNTTDTDIGPEIQDRRGSSAAAATNPDLLPQDFILVDLFKVTSQDTRNGLFNINSQFNVPTVPTPDPTATPVIDQGGFVSLFTSVPVGGGVPGSGPGSTPTVLSTSAVTTLSTITAGHRSAVAALATGGPGTTGSGAPIDNPHRHPYFSAGEIASDISWLINQSENAIMTGNSRNRTRVNYSLLRATPTGSTWNRNYGTDIQVEEAFRKVSDAITSRGNVFRILYVGQTIKDANADGIVNRQSEVVAEYLGEAFVERHSEFAPPPGATNADAVGTSNSNYRILTNRIVTE